MDSWSCVERARTIGEATLIQRALQAEGIATALSGEHRAGIAGVLPTADSEVEVLVPPSEIERAKAVLEKLRAADVTPWKCEECGEENPGNFDECWKCTRDAVAVEAPAQPEAARATRPRVSLFALTVVLIGVVAFVAYRQGQQSMPGGSDLTYSAMSAHEGCVEERFRSTNNVFVEWCDVDQNGIYEKQISYSRAAIKLSEFTDADQNGVFEKMQNFDKAGRVTVEYFDDDQNGASERRIDHDPDETWYDTDEDGRYERKP